MNRIKKLLVSKYEETTHKSLLRIAGKHNSQIFAKVRVADVMGIQNSGLSNEDYSYALKAHFDFVFCDLETTPLFAVEFDGAHHFLNADVKKKDRQKNAICKKFNFPLLRIDKSYLDRIENFATVLDWIIDMWFTEQEWNLVQSRGEIPYDQEFFPFLASEWGYVIDGNFTKINSDGNLIETIKQAMEAGGKLTSRSIDPFVRYRAHITRLANQGYCSHITTHKYHNTDNNYRSAISYVKLKNENYIFGTGSCRISYFIREAQDMAYYLADVDLAHKIAQHQRGNDTTCSFEEVQQKIKEIRMYAI